MMLNMPKGMDRLFKLGVITDEISQDFEVALSVAAKYQLDAVEIRSVWDKSAHELGNSDIAKIKGLLDKTGLQVCAISSQFFKCSMNNAAEISAHMEILDKCTRLAQELGTSLIRGFTFWNEGAFDTNFTQILNRFRAPVRMLQKKGMTLVLESDPSVYASNAQKLKRIIEGLGLACVKALWDPGNDIYDPDGEKPFPDGYGIIKPYMAHMHLKDAAKSENGKITGMPVGQGQVDYIGQLQALINDGYTGYVVLETHYRPKHEISDKLMLMPKGSAFSYLGKEATEECLENWFTMMKSIKYS